MGLKARYGKRGREIKRGRIEGESRNGKEKGRARM